MLSTLMKSDAAASAGSFAGLTASSAPLLTPVVTLLGWTLVMEVWMYCTRIPAMFKHKVGLRHRRARMSAVLVSATLTRSGCLLAG